MSNESKRIPPVSEWQGLWIGILVVSVFVVSLIDWILARAKSVCGLNFIPTNQRRR